MARKATRGWLGHKSPIAQALGRAWGGNDFWENDKFPGAQIQRVHHQTAIWPFFVVGIPELEGRTFRNLNATIDAIEPLQKQDT